MKKEQASDKMISVFLLLITSKASLNAIYLQKGITNSLYFNYFFLILCFKIKKATSILKMGFMKKK